MIQYIKYCFLLLFVGSKNKEGGFLMTIKKEEKPFLTYKGKPLVRRGDTIYYGNFQDKLIVTLTVVNGRQLGDLSIASTVTISLMTNDQSGAGKVIRKAERDGIYRALDIGAYWLEDSLEQLANMKK